jgi:hypothetical protein
LSLGSELHEAGRAENSVTGKEVIKRIKSILSIPRSRDELLSRQSVSTYTIYGDIELAK